MNTSENFDNLNNQLEREEEFMANLLSDEMCEEIMKAREADQSKFQSYWEADENDIETWTDVAGL
jgi:hypothetical protein